MTPTSKDLLALAAGAAVVAAAIAGLWYWRRSWRMRRRTPMVNPYALMASGVLPIKNKPARFAVGDPNGLTSNSWRVWVERKSELYITCRDNFTEAKVSLHASGRWRMGYTNEAIKRKPELVGSGENRAWEVWDKPAERLPDAITAFHLFFPTSELAVEPNHRLGKKWKDVIYIEPAPAGKLTTMTLFITKGDLNLTHESEPSFTLASFELLEGRYAKLVAHGDPEGFIPEMLAKSLAHVWVLAAEKKIDVPAGAFSYFFGHRDNGARFLVGARMRR